METTIKVASVFRATENGKRFIKLVSNSNIFHRIERDTWEKKETNAISISIAQLIKLSSEDFSELGLKLQFMLLNFDEKRVESAFKGTVIDVSEELIDAGTIISNDDGTEFAAEHDYYRVTAFAIKAVDAFGKYALEYDGDAPFNPNSKEAFAAFVAAAKAAKAAKA